MQNKSVHILGFCTLHSFHDSILILALVGLMFVSFPFLGRGEDKILFIGNSYTYGASDPGMNTQKDGGVPAIFSALARAGGQGKPVVVMQTVGGTDYKFHCQKPATKSAIKSQDWTYVVLQDYSTEPTHYVDTRHSVANEREYGLKLYNQIMANNPKTRVVLYETWSRPVANTNYITGTSTPTGFASTSEMQRELRTNYFQLADLMDSANPAGQRVIVAPVGDAWQNAGGLLPSTDPYFANLFKSDNYHGNDSGYYLAAAVFYSSIYGVSPHGLSKNPVVDALHLNFTVPPTRLEDVAWNTVKSEIASRRSTIIHESDKLQHDTNNDTHAERVVK